jgi:hypothetical protein
VKLRGVGEGELGGLLGHGLADFGDAVTDGDYGGLAAGVEETSAGLVDYPTAFASDGDWVVFAEFSGE